MVRVGQGAGLSGDSVPIGQAASDPADVVRQRVGRLGPSPDPMAALHKAGSIWNEQLEAAARLRHDYQLRVAAMMPASARVGERVDESTVAIGVPLSMAPDGYRVWATEIGDEPAPGNNHRRLLQLVIDMVVDGQSVRQCEVWYRVDRRQLEVALRFALDRYPL